MQKFIFQDFIPINFIHINIFIKITYNLMAIITYAIINVTTLSEFQQRMYISKFVKEIAKQCVIIHLNRIDILVSTLFLFIVRVHYYYYLFLFRFYLQRDNLLSGQITIDMIIIQLYGIPRHLMIIQRYFSNSYLIYSIP